MPGWLGPWEILIVVVIILLIFGGRLLPRLGRSLGGSVTSLKKGLKEGGEEFKTAVKEEEETASSDMKVDSSAVQNPPQGTQTTGGSSTETPPDRSEQS